MGYKNEIFFGFFEKKLNSAVEGWKKRAHSGPGILQSSSPFQLAGCFWLILGFLAINHPNLIHVGGLGGWHEGVGSSPIYLHSSTPPLGKRKGSDTRNLRGWKRVSPGRDIFFCAEQDLREFLALILHRNLFCKVRRNLRWRMQLGAVCTAQKVKIVWKRVKCKAELRRLQCCAANWLSILESLMGEKLF